MMLRDTAGDCLTEKEIGDHLAGRLGAEQTARVARHVQACEACRRSVESRQAATQVVDTLDLEAHAVGSSAVGASSASGSSGSGPLIVDSSDGGSGGRSAGNSPGDRAEAKAYAESIPGYELLEEIHRGGQGVVFRAVQKATKRVVAVKILLEGVYASVKQRQRFEREIDLAASLQHPYIVTVYDSGRTPSGLNFLAMEYVPGPTLRRFAAEHADMPLAELLGLFVKIVEAVSHAHLNGVIHRDLKPENILVSRDGQPRVLDFGLAKPAADLNGLDDPNAEAVTKVGDFLGTLAYASPEQASGGASRVDVRSDVYALGVVLYELLSGRYPYPVQGPLADVLRNIAEAAPTPLVEGRRSSSDGAPLVEKSKFPVDSVLQAVLLKALAKHPDDRYQSAAAFVDDLRHYLAGEPVQAQPPSAAVLLRLWVRQNFDGVRGGLWSVAVGLVMGLIPALMMPSVLDQMLQNMALAYSRFPTLTPPTLLTFDFSAGGWKWMGLVGLAATPAFGMSVGFLLVWLANPRRMWGDVALGGSAGLAASLTTFLTGLGWGAVVATTVVPAIPDLQLLAQSARSEATPDADPLSKTYPDLAQQPFQERADMLMGKLLADMVNGSLQGVWIGMVASLVGGLGLCLPSTVAAGFVVRRHRSWWKRGAAYLELFIPLTLLVVRLGLYGMTWQNPPGVALWLAVGACLTAASLGWSLWLRLGLFVLCLASAAVGSTPLLMFPVLGCFPLGYMLSRRR